MEHIYVVNLFSKRSIAGHYFGIPAYKIFATYDAADQYIKNFEQLFKEQGNREAEGYVDVIFEIEERIVHESAELGKENECLTGHRIM